MKKIFTPICVLAFILFSIGLSAQTKGAAIVFINTTHDFGTIVETNGLATCSFEFTNTGDQPLVISQVSASCGCTSPAWSKEPIAPGAKGFVQATYNPLGRVAPFDKALTVSSNGTPARVTLRIKGNVIRKPIPVEESHPLTIGNLRLKSLEAKFNTLTNTETRTIVIETANGTDSPVSFTFDKTPEYINIAAEPTTLQAKQKGLIKVTFDAKKKPAFGYSNDKITVKQGSSKGAITVAAVVKENAIVNNPANAPRLKSNNIFDFGTAAKGKSATATFEITNEGKEDLILHNVTGENIKSSVKNVKIKPGKSQTIKINYTPNQAGTAAGKAYIATNDPNNTIYEVTIKGTVN